MREVGSKWEWMSVWQELYHCIVLTETSLVCAGVSTVLSNISSTIHLERTESSWSEGDFCNLFDSIKDYLLDLQCPSALFFLFSPVHSQIQEVSPRRLCLHCQLRQGLTLTFLQPHCSYTNMLTDPASDQCQGRSSKPSPGTQWKPRLLLLTSGRLRHRQGRDLGLVSNATFDIIQTEVTQDLQLTWHFSQ